MAVTPTSIKVRIDLSDGVSIGYTESGRELFRYPLPPRAIALYREVKREKLRQSIMRQCAGIRRRQQRRSK